MLKVASNTKVREKVSFSTGQRASLLEVAGKTELDEALKSLGLGGTRPVIVPTPM